VSLNTLVYDTQVLTWFAIDARFCIHFWGHFVRHLIEFERFISISLMTVIEIYIVHICMNILINTIHNVHHSRQFNTSNKFVDVRNQYLHPSRYRIITNSLVCHTNRITNILVAHNIISQTIYHGFIPYHKLSKWMNEWMNEWMIYEAPCFKAPQ